MLAASVPIHDNNKLAVNSSCTSACLQRPLTLCSLVHWDLEKTLNGSCFVDKTSRDEAWQSPTPTQNCELLRLF